MTEVEKVSDEFEGELQKVEVLLSGGIPINDIETFKHHAHIFFKFGYAVGKHDKKEEKKRNE